MFKKSILKLLSLTNSVCPKSKENIVFISSPDFTDNSFALFKYMIENESSIHQYIWLVDDIKNKRLYLKMIDKYIHISSSQLSRIQIIKKNSLSGIFKYAQSKYIFFTHGFYTGISIPNNQQRINLWHGMPLKAIGHINKHGNKNKIPASSYTIATSSLFKEIMAKAFSLSSEKVLLVGQPKYDFINSHYSKKCLKHFHINQEKYAKIILWAPTFRYSKDQQIKDGEFRNTLPLLEEGQINFLNNYLQTINAYLMIKLHPMDILNTYDFGSFTHLQIIRDAELLHHSCQITTLLAASDILITDFSSIYIDYLLLDRPIIFAIDDFEKYLQTRNFVFKNPKMYMPGPIVENTQSLIAALDDIITHNNDSYMEKRDELKQVFHVYEDAFCKRLLENLEL